MPASMMSKAIAIATTIGSPASIRTMMTQITSTGLSSNRLMNALQSMGPLFINRSIAGHRAARAKSSGCEQNRGGSGEPHAIGILTVSPMGAVALDNVKSVALVKLLCPDI